MFTKTCLIRFLPWLPAIALLTSTVLLRGQNPTPNPQPAPAANFRIAGTVVSSLDGSALAQARVSLIDTRNPANAASIITSGDGQFEFTSLPPGKFALQGARRGFLSEMYEQHEQFSTAIVTGQGFDTEHLVLRLTPLAFLTGKIVDEVGEPVRDARVTLHVESHRGGMDRIERRGNTNSDDQGYYEFPALAPGNYYVSVSAKPWYAVHPASSYDGWSASSPQSGNRSLDVAYPITYFNGATDAEAATAISLHPGDHLQADIHLSPVPALHLIIRQPEDAEGGFRMPMLQKRALDRMEWVQPEGGQSIAPGVYEITAVPSGKYLVSWQDPNGSRSQGATELNLQRDGQELDTAHVEAAASVKVSVKMPDEEPIPKEFYVALQNSRNQLVGGYSQSVDPGGGATFEGLAAGKYSILVFCPDKRYSVVRMLSQGREIPGHEVEVSAGVSQDLTVFPLPGVVAVEGLVSKAGKPAAGVMVALIPADPDSHRDLFRRDQSDFDGSFTLPNIIPGSYTIVAVEDAWGFPWLQPGVLARYVQHGQNLTIGELMQGSVHLPEPIEVQPH